MPIQQKFRTRPLKAWYLEASVTLARLDQAERLGDREAVTLQHARLDALVVDLLDPHGPNDAALVFDDEVWIVRQRPAPMHSQIERFEVDGMLGWEKDRRDL